MARSAGRTNGRKARMKPPPSSVRVDASLVGMVGLVGRIHDVDIAAADDDATHDD